MLVDDHAFAQLDCQPGCFCDMNSTTAIRQRAGMRDAARAAVDRNLRPERLRRHLLQPCKMHMTARSRLGSLRKVQLKNLLSQGSTHLAQPCAACLVVPKGHMGVQKGWEQVWQQVGLSGDSEGSCQEPAEQLVVLAQECTAAWLCPMAVDQQGLGPGTAGVLFTAAGHGTREHRAAHKGIC